jgi:hypothetical protein
LLGLRDQGASRKVSRYEWLTSLRGIVRDGNRQARYSEELGVTHGAVTERVKSLKANLERLPHSVQDHILNNQQKPSIVELLPGTQQHVQACYELLGIDASNKQNNPNPADRLSAFRRMLGGATKKQLACEYGVSYHNLVTILNKMHRRYNALSDAEQASIKAV